MLEELMLALNDAPQNVEEPKINANDAETKDPGKRFSQSTGYLETINNLFIFLGRARL